jgi:hypothetical protein
MSNLTLSATKAILPFSVLSENRTDPFTSEMEIATICALAELRREKGGGLLSKRQEEKISFISKIGYPLWLIPVFEKPLLFDGLNRFNHKVAYAKIPNVKLFIENLKRSSKTYETHLAFLSDHLNYFETPIEEKETIIKGLISDSDFLTEFDSYYNEAKEIEEEPYEIGLLPQIIENTDISSGLEELKTIHTSIKENKDKLYRCMKLIKKINSQHVDYLRSITGETKYKFKESIKKEEEIVKPQIVHLKKDYDYQIVKTTKSFQRQELPLYKEKIKLEKSKKTDETKIGNCKFEALRCAEKNDKTGEQKWKERSKRTKKIVSEISKKLRETEKNLEILKERKTLAIFRLKSELESKIKDLQKNLRDLEASCEAKVLGYEQEIEKLKKNSKIIIDQLGRFTKIEETDLNEFANLGIKENPELRKSTLFYVSFYLICYQIKSKKRYSIMSPSIVNTVCLTTKLRSFGRSKIKQVLSNRFHTMASLVDELYILIQQNHMFQVEIKEIGEKFNLLDKSSINTQISKGLALLKNEGWLSEKEYEILIPK